MNKKGFTLIEILVVVVVVSVLAAISLTQMAKIVENSKLTDAITLINAVANAQKMARLEYPNTVTAQFGKLQTIKSGTCAATSTSLSTIADYMNCKYLTQHDWSNLSYTYYICNGSGGGGGCCGDTGSPVACATRGSTVHPASGDYAGWHVGILSTGQCVTSCASCKTQPPNCPTI